MKQDPTAFVLSEINCLWMTRARLISYFHLSKESANRSRFYVNRLDLFTSETRSNQIKERANCKLEPLFVTFILLFIKKIPA